MKTYHHKPKPKLISVRKCVLPVFKYFRTCKFVKKCKYCHKYVYGKCKRVCYCKLTVKRCFHRKCGKRCLKFKHVWFFRKYFETYFCVVILNQPAAVIR